MLRRTVKAATQAVKSQGQILAKLTNHQHLTKRSASSASSAFNKARRMNERYETVRDATAAVCTLVGGLGGAYAMAVPCVEIAAEMSPFFIPAYLAVGAAVGGVIGATGGAMVGYVAGPPLGLVAKHPVVATSLAVAGVATYGISSGKAKMKVSDLENWLSGSGLFSESEEVESTSHAENIRRSGPTA